MSEARDEEKSGLPPFWWVWVLAALALVAAVSLFVYRFWVLDQVPVPGRVP